jgi:ring-1,2-phenylacetyl-CoA epoxidase subunit PaaC
MLNESPGTPLVEFLLGLGDDALIAGHRLSEWCGHGPTLEEDIALANLALDCLGTANSILSLAGEREGAGRSADDLAYFRDDLDFRNALLLELPKGDFARTILRQYFSSLYDSKLYGLLTQSKDSELSGIAARTLKERKYHVRHCGEWVLRLGSGTDESHRRVQEALDFLWGYTGELFERRDSVDQLISSGLIPDIQNVETDWRSEVSQHLHEASLVIPDDCFQHSGGRKGLHTEYLGHLLSEMQILARSHPEAKW